MQESLLIIRPAVVGDADVIMAFILELAEHQNLAHEVSGTVEMVREGLFGPRPAAEALLACVDDEPVGMALFFQSFSTFSIKPGIYLEDLYVRPKFRKLGLGKALLTEVAKLAVERGGFFEWSVLHSNRPSIQFYESLGAVMHGEWRRMRLEGRALGEVANRGV